MHEIETKVLDINQAEIEKKLTELGAVKTDRTLLKVTWYQEKGTKQGEEEWYLRIRSYDDKKHEVTWKAKSEIIGIARKHKEINFLIEEPLKLADLFEEINLESYAHQEKYRTTYKLKDWQFDIDEYPKMPAYVEIEGKSEEHIKEAMTLLNIEDKQTTSEGETKLIRNVYGLDWNNMSF